MRIHMLMQSRVNYDIPFFTHISTSYIPESSIKTDDRNNNNVQIFTNIFKILSTNPKKLIMKYKSAVY